MDEVGHGVTLSTAAQEAVVKATLVHPIRRHPPIQPSFYDLGGISCTKFLDSDEEIGQVYNAVKI